MPAAETDRPDTDRPTSPAVVLTVLLGFAGLLVALNPTAFAVSLFLCAASLAALPMALADRPGARAVRFTLLGAGCAVLGLALVLVPLLTGSGAQQDRTQDPARTEDRPALPQPAPPAASPAVSPAATGATARP